MKIVGGREEGPGGGGYETLVGNKNLVEGRGSLLGVTFPAMSEAGGAGGGHKQIFG